MRGFPLYGSSREEMECGLDVEYEKAYALGARDFEDVLRAMLLGVMQHGIAYGTDCGWGLLHTYELDHHELRIMAHNPPAWGRRFAVGETK